jgi:hypothetical protein
LEGRKYRKKSGGELKPLLEGYFFTPENGALFHPW